MNIQYWAFNIKHLFHSIGTAGIIIAVLGCDSSTPPSDRQIKEVVTHETSITKKIGPEGGIIEVADPESPIFGAKVEIPEDALTSDKDLSITYVPTPDNPPTDILSAGNTIDFLPDGISFQKDVDLFLPYNDLDNDGFIDDSTISENSTSVVVYNENSELWKNLPVENRDVENNLVQIQTNHFSRYSTVNYLTKLCETVDTITYGPFYFTLQYNYRFLPHDFRASVSDVGADLNVSNTTLLDLNSAILEYSGFKDFFDKVVDATIWTWTWKVDPDLTMLSLKVGLNDDEVVTEIQATAPTVLKFSWNFDYERMAPSEMLVIIFYGTTNKICTLLDRIPKTPTNLYVASTTDTSVELIWDEVINIYGDVMYNLYMRTANEDFDSFVTFTTNTATIGGLDPLTNYSFKVTTAYDNNLESGDSNIVSATTNIANTPPSKPENLIASSIDRNGFTLTWEPSSDDDGHVIGYIIYISDDGNTYSSLEQTNKTSYIVPYLHPSSTYYCKVAAVDNDNTESDLSEPVIVNTL